MTARDKATLKSYFDTGDVPTSEQLNDLIDSIPDNLDNNYLKLDASNGPITSDLEINGLTIGAGVGNKITNTKVGYGALLNLSGNGLFDGTFNSVLGRSAGAALTTGYKNCLFGYYSGRTLLVGNNNTFMGHDSGSEAKGSSCVMIGAGAQPNPQESDNSIVIGANADGAGSNTVVLGNDNITDTYLKGSIHIPSDSYVNGLSLGMGYETPEGLYIGRNVRFGKDALLSNTDGYQNIAIGYEALKANTKPNNNIAIGYQALWVNDGEPLTTTASQSNIAIGNNAMMDNLGGSANTAIGHNSLQRNTTGKYNTAIGYLALGGNTTGEENLAIGQSALGISTTASRNIAVGYGSGAGNGSDNVSIGNRIGQNRITSGDKNTFIGTLSGGAFNALQKVDPTNTIAIGADSYTTQDNQTVIGNALTTQTKLFGVLNLIQKTPLTSTATGTLGDICCDTDYIYACTATNTWKRSPLTTW